MPPTMRKAILQAALVFLISMIIEHYISEDMIGKALQNSAFKELHDEIMRLAFSEPGTYSLAPTANSTIHRTNGAGNRTNSTSELDELMGGLKEMSRAKVTFGKVNFNAGSFFGCELPREIIIFVIITILRYQWFFWLERILPARPRYTGSLSQQDKKSAEENGLGEKCVDMPTTRGKKQRPSLNKRNTFYKWVVECTLGTGWRVVLSHIIRLLLHLQSPQTILKGLRSQMFYGLLSNSLSCTPWVALVAFIAIPVHNQVVFVTAADSIGSIFLTKLFSIVAVWFIERDGAEQFLLGMAETARVQADLLRHDEM